MTESVAIVRPATTAAVVEQPLGGLLQQAADAFASNFEARLSESSFCSLSLANSRNVLRHLGDGPKRACQLGERADVSKQALSQQIAHLEKHGYLRTEPDPTDARARVLTLTPRGQEAQALVEHLFVEVEAEWAKRIGTQAIAQLRDTLSLIIGQEAEPTCPGRPAD